MDVDEEEVISPPQNFLDQLRSKLPPPFLRFQQLKNLQKY